MNVPTVREKRGELAKRLFPRGIPRLWCPPIAHYAEDGSLSRQRISAHIASIAPHIGGLLVPGSTGDGWELGRREKLELVDIAAPLAAKLGLHLLIGVLERSTEDMISFVEALGPRLRASSVVGIVVCPPSETGAAEERIEAGLERILGLGLPTALYQLPQVTGTEMTPGTVARLAKKYPNAMMLKDSSGEDRVARSGLDFEGLFLVRGAELGYSGWLAPAGPYNGFLLSTANWLAPQLSSIVAGECDPDLGRRVDAVAGGAFGLVRGMSSGNAFSNSARLMDHVMAYGAGAAAAPLPRARCGGAFSRELVGEAADLLGSEGLLPRRGYFADAR
jgi:dihydrodipicolinate synthase/N-acetylneuraminate lyase